MVLVDLFEEEEVPLGEEMIPEMLEMGEATTSGKCTIDEEMMMSMEKQNEEKSEKKKDKKEKNSETKKDKKTKKEKMSKKEKKKRKEEVVSAGIPRTNTEWRKCVWGAAEHGVPEVQDKRQKKLHGDPMPEIIQDATGDTFALAKFIGAAHELMARARKEQKKLFLDLCGGEGAVARRAQNRHGLIGVGMDWKKGPIHIDLKRSCIYNYVEKEMVEEGLVAAAMIHAPCETWSSAHHGRPGDGTPV